MPRRRGNREGSSFKRKDGRWVAEVSLLGGKRLTYYGKTQQHCREWLQEIRNQMDEGLTIEGAKTSTGKFLDNWLETVKPTLHPNTWTQYSAIIDRYIKPGLAVLRLKDLRLEHIQTLYSNRLEAGTGARTVRLIHAVLHRALNQALKWGPIQRNPATAVEKPRQPRPEMRTLDVRQTRDFLRAAQGYRLETLFHLAITTGLRRGELLGLQWNDLDWGTGKLQVRRQLQRVVGKGLVFNEPKTAAGRRPITVGQTDLAQLQQHRKRQLEERLFAGCSWQDHGLIFASAVGTPLDPRNVFRDFKNLLKTADLPDIRFYDLRHTAATLMLQQRVHPKVVQERLGHSTISMTLDTHSHVLPTCKMTLRHAWRSC